MCLTPGWVRRSRVWRLAFLADEGGFWDPSPCLATALFATKRKPETIGSEPLHPLISWITVGAPFNGDDAARSRQPDAAGPDAERGAGAASASDDALPADCPLTLGDEDALRWSVPVQLRDAAFVSAGFLDPVRVWTTCLCVCSLMGHNEAYLLDDDFTLADRGFQWLEEQAMLHPHFGLVLGETLARARETVGAWERYHYWLVKAAKAVEDGNRVRSVKERDRLLAHCTAKALGRSGPETVQAWASTGDDGLLRWQRMYVLFTSILLLMVVEIWFLWSRAVRAGADGERRVVIFDSSA